MKCIIIEDEIPAQNVVKAFLNKMPNVKLVATFQTALDAHVFFKTQTVDVLFLDINLPDISGLDFIKTIKNPPKVIMTTAYPNYAVDSFELDTIVDYLVKPFSFDRFLKAIKKAENRQSLQKEEPKYIFLNVDKTLYKLFLEDILYLESDRNYVTVATQTKKHVLIDSLKSWNEKLRQYHFQQVHKSYIVNTKKVEKIAGNEIFIAKKRIPIGRTFKTDFLSKLKI